ncbi:sterol desaturase family protein [uncultured Neptuniibacter sp.]|uniref:sterol desaturase family protein n=1 Tax=uncultured Neptuniibacter sp. TaxID=502143 RepID=UPI00262F2510|nr:sterol desaturase family protein [uncultured Neptuniibacter sp.]
MFESLVISYVQDLWIALTDPRKRVFWGYLLISLLIAICWIKWVSPDRGVRVKTHLFNRKVWWSASARADYAIFLLNRLAFLFIAPVLLTQLVVAQWLFESLYQWIGHRPILGESWSDMQVMICFTLFYFLLDDFFRFYLHKLLHEVPWLWAFHKVHHSARTLTPITVFRAHPVEGVLFSLRTALVQGIAMGVFVFFFGGRVDLVTVLGASIFAFMFNVTGSNLRHSHIALRYGKALEKWLISPAQHQIHHSTNPIHFDKNYGVVLALWDRLFGSLVISQPGQDIEFGLRREVTYREQNLLYIYMQPFIESFNIFLSKVRKREKSIAKN